MTLTDMKEIKDHVEGFYKDLFGKEDRGAISLDQDIWRNGGRLSEEEREILEATFTMEEVERAVKEMKPNTAPSPDGFPIGFYKKFWDIVKLPLKEMMNRLYDGKLNLCRLITLIPKVN